WKNRRCSARTCWVFSRRSGAERIQYADAQSRYVTDVSRHEGQVIRMRRRGEHDIDGMVVTGGRGKPPFVRNAPVDGQDAVAAGMLDMVQPFLDIGGGQ